jgi:hypothetical protein
MNQTTYKSQLAKRGWDRCVVKICPSLDERRRLEQKGWPDSASTIVRNCFQIVSCDWTVLWSARPHFIFAFDSNSSRRQGELRTSSQLVDTWIRVNDPSAGSPTERWMSLRLLGWMSDRLSRRNQPDYLLDNASCVTTGVTHCYVSLWTASERTLRWAWLGLGCWWSIVLSYLILTWPSSARAEASAEAIVKVALLDLVQISS